MSHIIPINRPGQSARPLPEGEATPAERMILNRLELLAIRIMSGVGELPSETAMDPVYDPAIDI